MVNLYSVINLNLIVFGYYVLTTRLTKDFIAAVIVRHEENPVTFRVVTLAL
jgi:hypothetical protein